jgi:DNA-binding MarR family transcriptional regulator
MGLLGTALGLWPSRGAFDGLLVPIYIVQVILSDSPSAGDDTGAAAGEPEPSREDLLREIAEGVVVLAGRRRCAVARRVHHSGISLGHLQILWILQEHGPLPVSRLADWLGIGAPNATGLLDRMEQRGLVARVRDAEDRRVVLASMTDEGRATIAEHDGWGFELVEQLLGPLPTDQLLAVAAGVRRIRAEAAS